MILKNIYIKFKNKTQRGRYNRGVSLIELLVVIVIFMIISGMTIFSYNDFKSSASIQNLADDIALSVRKAQNYATGVVGSYGYFSQNYGINFSIKTKALEKETKGNPGFEIEKKKTVSSSNQSFILFIDRNKSGSYDEDPVSSCSSLNDPSCLEYLEILSITSNDMISGIGLQMGEKLVPLKGNDQIDLLFKRPTPEPVFCYRKDNASACNKDSNKISAVAIYISSKRDQTISKKITISNNGQISVDF